MNKKKWIIFIILLIITWCSLILNSDDIWELKVDKEWVTVNWLDLGEEIKKKWDKLWKDIIEFSG